MNGLERSFGAVVAGASSFFPRCRKRVFFNRDAAAAAVPPSASGVPVPAVSFSPELVEGFLVLLHHLAMFYCWRGEQRGRDGYRAGVVERVAFLCVRRHVDQERSPGLFHGGITGLGSVGDVERLHGGAA